MENNKVEQEINKWENVLEKDKHYSVQDWIKTISNINIMYSIIEYRSKLLRKQEPKKDTVNNICNFVEQHNEKELQNILELMFLEPIQINKLHAVGKFIQDKNIIKNMVILHRNKKDFRLINILDQVI